MEQNMAFVSVMIDNEFHPDIVKEGENAVITCPIGYDDEEPLFYSLFVSLGPQVGGDLELSFCVVTTDADDNEVSLAWSGLETRTFLRGNDRKKVLELALVAIGLLLAFAKPERVFLCTYDRQMPEKAERKFLAIARSVETCGYKIGRYDSYEGQHVWAMERQ